jgi:subtilisin family serine protease
MIRLLLCSALLLPTSLLAQEYGQALLTNGNGDHYQRGVINLKVNAQYRHLCSESEVSIPELVAELRLLGLKTIVKKFKTTTPPTREFNDRGIKLADISLIYTAKVSDDADILEACKKLSILSSVEYAEPDVVSYDQHVPNDANLNSLMPYHFATTSTYEAWDITLGDTNVVIGITETSVDVNHPDLSGNVKYNYADTLNTLDDDNDGYTDNFAGWDMVDDDNNLFINNEIHGTAVSAIASATANNGIGYAGIGYKCKFLPVKVANSAQVITKGYEGIQYCIEQGCSVVNCSWGNTTFSQVAQDFVTWAAINNDVVLVASAGNNNATAMYYPASYNYVLSVTGVDAQDRFNNGVNAHFKRNDSVDVSAPGYNVYTTATFNGSYLYSPPQGGTSMAAPIVSGLAGLVRSQFPCLTALEVIEQIKSTADNVDGLVENIPYAGLIGSGRVNAEMAVTGTVCDPIGIQENTDLTSLEVYPNPSTEEVSVRTNRTSNWRLEILDASGKLIVNRAFYGSRSMVSGLAPGMYVVRLFDRDQMLSRPFTVIGQ